MKYFIISDTHSFYKCIKQGLDKAGYDKDNKDHTLVILGDIFDRGDETIELFNFIKSIPKDNLILVRGNHEDLFMQLVNRGYALKHDYSNCTTKTIGDIIDIDNIKEFCNDDWLVYLDDNKHFYDTWQRILRNEKLKPYIEFMSSNKWKNYVEIGPYILTHSFIPFKTRLNDSLLYDIESYELNLVKEHISYNKDWRTNASDYEWQKARWVCPYVMYNGNLFEDEEEQGKKLICGHWNTKSFYTYLDRQIPVDTVYYNKDRAIIGIDGGVYYDRFTSGYNYYHIVNVLMIDEDMHLYNALEHKQLF